MEMEKETDNRKKRTKSRIRNEEKKRRGKTKTRFGNQNKIRKPEQDLEAKTRIGSQNKILKPNKIPGKTQRLPGISIEFYKFSFLFV